MSLTERRALHCGGAGRRSSTTTSTDTNAAALELVTAEVRGRCGMGRIMQKSPADPVAQLVEVGTIQAERQPQSIDTYGAPFLAVVAVKVTVRRLQFSA